MNRYIIIALYALSFTLLFQYFFANKEKEVKNMNDIILTIVDDTVVVPNSPQIEIVNHTATGTTFHTCEDITLTVDSITISNLSE